MTQEGLRVGASDRLSFTLFLALALHAIVIFGISFSSRPVSSKSPTLDVTLSMHQSDDLVADADADFLADSNQQGSGTLTEKALLKSTEQADIEDNQIFHTIPTLTQLAYSELSLTNDRIITTTSPGTDRAVSNDAEQGDLDIPVQTDQAVVINNITDVATLKALLDDSRQAYAKRPRVRTLTAVSTKRAVDANYIFDWLQKVERIGNQNYPESARNQRISGSVRLAVSINADGSLRSVLVTSSSGHSLLDQAAKQIVYLAAPYPAFSATMVEQYDVLEVIRTWQFRIDNRFGVTNDR
ncbi:MULTISPECIES: energy transducer TonB [Reinekea]|jgi:protein TonB|uniref:TonB family C-terminal domain protein n=1 Tax=Reinekea forsetii TaxID=1336806 RepID=A0A2K8KYN0_9GAMM|nr:MULTISPECIES: energy transducer TonB [Reinekea]ATX77994.1 TonB family C-terminal domain protein [Reinekea forsetii]MDO7640713.1 energy transducer TonB [Reinekea forsetii]MDO7643579.1 energy transducer TonB [Reinekea forsetii]